MKKQQAVSRVIDGFLVSFTADHQNLEKKMNQQFASFRHGTRKFQKEWIGTKPNGYVLRRPLE